MTPVRFGVQVLIVLTLMLTVSWPEISQLRAGSGWRASGRSSADRAAASRNAARRGRTGGEYGFGSAAYAPPTAAGPTGLRQRLSEDRVEGRRRRAIPAGVLALGGTFNAILGRARTPLNSPMAGAELVLRNLDTGLVEARATADEAGQFVFLDLTPNNYIVELIGAGGEVNATSESLAIDFGDLVQTTVRGTGQGILTALFGPVMEATSNDAVSAASRDGVTRVAAPERCVSPPCSR